MQKYIQPLALSSVRSAIGRPDPFDNAPPFNLDAEQALLGAILINNVAIEKVADFVSAADFFDPLHQQIYEVMGTLIRGGRLVTPITVRTFFENAEPIRSDLTVPQYLGQLCVNATTIIGARDYGQTIRDLAIRRQLILIGEDMVAVARDSAVDAPPARQIEEAESRLFSLAQHNTAEQSTTLTFGEAANQAFETADLVARGKLVGLKTGLTDLDAKVVGPNATDLVILAGRPAMGKSALAANIAFHVARSGQGAVHFFSLEMSAEQIAMRTLGEQIEVASSRLRSGKASPSELMLLRQKTETLQGVPLFIDQAGGVTIAQLAARARRFKRKHNTALIVIDYIQLMQSSRRNPNANRVEDVREITTGLKALSKELNVPILALSQLSRNVEHRDNKRPQLPDLRESGSIEQDADIVLFVFREEYYLEREQPALTEPSAYADWQAKMAKVAGKAEIIIGKQRHGELGIVNVAFSGELTRFSNLAREVQRHA